MSGLPIENQMQIQAQFTSSFFLENRNKRYYEHRTELERLMRSLFIEKGGKPVLDFPYYMVIGESPLLATWYNESEYIKIPINEFDLSMLSFTYGDSFPTFSQRITDGMEYRKKVYLYDEILMLIQKYGLPQDTWNETYESPCYVEVQIWSDIPINRYQK